MNTIDQSSVEHTLHQTPDGDITDSLERLEHKIAGYDGGTRPVFKEPSLYLSIVIIFIATYACLSKTPTVFWLSSLAMIAVTISLHVLAERLLFRSNKEYDMFAAPLEGVFVVTLGAILPGIGLLAYGIYSLSTAQHPNVLEELGKIGLLLIVPLFNFIVWSAVKKGYLIRPRLIGLMNGLALGLSASWTVVWIKTAILIQGVPSCKFGWMLLLFTSPFLLFAAACLSFDLWRKTAPSIARITTTFAVLGGLLSLLFVFTPMARAFYVQFLLMDAKTGSGADQNRALPVLRSIATAEDLRPSRYPVGGFALAELLIPDRGLDRGAEVERSLFFKITGQPFSEADGNHGNASNLIQSLINPVIGSKIHGLSLSKSQINGSVDAATLSSSIDWSLTLHNSTQSTQEARCEIALPKQAVVSHVTLWVNGEPRDAAVGSTEPARSTYVDGGQIDPLLVTMNAPDRILVQCFRVQANGGEEKICIGFKVPLETVDGKTCSLKLPKFLDSNFAQPKRNRINLSLKDRPTQKLAGMVTSKNGDRYALSGIIRPNDQNELNFQPIQRTTSFTEFATPDPYSHDKRYIVEQLKEVIQPAPKRLFVVLDSSASLKDFAAQIKQALSNIPAAFKTTIILAKDRDSEKETASEAVAKQSQHEQAEQPTTEQASSEPTTSEQATSNQSTPEKAPVGLTPASINSDSFVGGQDNQSVLKETLETAAEEPNSAVLWIHGPQPIANNSSESTMLDLVHRVGLYNLQIAPGPDVVLPALKTEDVLNLITCENLSHKSTDSDVKALVSSWQKGTKTLSIKRWATTTPPLTAAVMDHETSSQVISLWAAEQVAKLLESGLKEKAQVLAAKYRLVSPVTGAIMLADPKDYAENRLKPGSFRNAGLIEASSGAAGTTPLGLVGAPIDPRYGQSNEVGQMAVFGYDTARDIVRLLVAVSLLLSVMLAAQLLRSKKPITGLAVLKATVLLFAIPTVVHLIGTFMINNFGGLGGGL